MTRYLRYFQFSSVKKARSLFFLTERKLQKCDGMNMEMTLPITNKLVENLFKIKCFFYMSSSTQLRFKCEKFQLLWSNILPVSRGILEAATRCILLKRKGVLTNFAKFTGKHLSQSHLSLIGETRPPTSFVRQWTSIDYCKTSDFFFWIIVLHHH